MKSILALLLLVVLPLVCPAQDYETEGAPAATLKFAIAYQPKDRDDVERFQITLTNVSGKDLALAVTDNRFEGTVVIALKGGKPVEFYEKEFRGKIMIGIVPIGFTNLAKDRAIVWNIPITDLRDLHGSPVKAEALHEARVHAVLTRVAIVPPKGKTMASSNARQKSPAITVSKQ